MDFSPFSNQASSQLTPKHTVAEAMRKTHAPNASIGDLIAAVVRAQRLKLITIREVRERAAVGNSFIYAESAAGRFPKPVKLGASRGRRSAARFVDGEISDWIEQRIAERDALADSAANEKGLL